MQDVTNSTVMPYAQSVKEAYEGWGADPLKPDYYNQNDIEIFDVIDAYDMDFYLGNVLKYIARWNEKGGVRDLEKALVYLKRKIDAEQIG